MIALEANAVELPQIAFESLSEYEQSVGPTSNTARHEDSKSTENTAQLTN
jgi:hypothetical protein